MLTKEQDYWINELTADVAEQRVKFSSLNTLPNDQMDSKADELKAVLKAAIESWIVREEDELEDLKERSLAQREEMEYV